MNRFICFVLGFLIIGNTSYAHHNKEKELTALRNERNWSIMALSTGAGLGILATSIALISKGAYSLNGSFCWFGKVEINKPVPCPNREGWTTPLLISGVSLAVLSVAIGVPWLVTTHRKVKRAQRMFTYPAINAHFDGKNVGVTAAWMF